MRRCQKLSHGFAFECYYCGKFFARADKQGRRIENCSGVPGIIYIFNNKHLITFEDNFKSKGGMAMAMYCDFDCYNPEQKTMFVLSYVLIVAFDPHLNLRKVIVQRSYRYSLEQLTMIDYLTNDQMSFIDVTLVKQLNDIAQEVSRRKCKNDLYERKNLIDNKNKNLKVRWKQSVWFRYDKTITDWLYKTKSRHKLDDF